MAEHINDEINVIGVGNAKSAGVKTGIVDERQQLLLLLKQQLLKQKKKQQGFQSK